MAEAAETPTVELLPYRCVADGTATEPRRPGTLFGWRRFDVIPISELAKAQRRLSLCTLVG